MNSGGERDCAKLLPLLARFARREGTIILLTLYIGIKVRRFYMYYFLQVASLFQVYRKLRLFNLKRFI